MTRNRRGERPQQEPMGAEGGAAAESRRPPSDTPPPISLPDDADNGQNANRDREDIRSPFSGRQPSGRLGEPSLFTPSFTLMGSGPPDPSRPAGQSGWLPPGSTFGVYLVGECIGQGGMARIYQAEHAGLRRKVALKVLIDGFARDVDGRERFLREARLAASIKHPNVVNIFDVGLCEDVPYLVMELLEGQDLEQLLQSKGALEEGQIIDIMIPAVAGLAAVHDAGIVHRDLKPGNIFLARGRYNDIEPKLLDFGISKAQGAEQLKLTANRGVMGTPFYISPEGVHGGEMTPLSDQYSLGVVMYECATGCTPFNATAFTELSRRISSGEYTLPNIQKPELSKRLGRIIERAMSLEPERRFKDMREMGRELLLLAGQRTRITWGLSFGEVRELKKEDGHAPNAGASKSAPEPQQPAERRRAHAAPIVVAIGAFLLLVIVLFPLRSALVSLYSGSRAPAAAGAAGGQPEAKDSPRVVNAPAAPNAGAHEPLPAAPALIERPETGERAALPTDPADALAVRGNVAHAGRSDITQNPVRRNQRAAAPPVVRGRPTSANPEADPPWAIPATASSTGQINLQVGPNGSPIFD